MHVIYAGEPLPAKMRKAVFLAGPSPRDEETKSWRPEALKLLEEAGFDGYVFVPEARDGARPDFIPQMQWELDAMNSSDVIIFWIARDMAKMPALTTNNEFGIWSILDPARVYLGAPPEAPHTSYQFKFAEKHNIPSFRDLSKLVQAVVAELGEGAERSGGSCQVPLHIWNTTSFQAWYGAQTKAGIELHGARVVWCLRIRAKFVLYWAIKVDMFIPAEQRHKTNEVVISRPDVCLTVAWHRPAGAEADDTVFALIKEYRTPTVSADAFAYENPGGSSFDPNEDPRKTAASELKDELGLEVDPARVKTHCARQLIATLSAHRAHVFSVELTGDELAALRKVETAGTPLGVDTETERTYPRVLSFKEIRTGQLVDWATIGMLFTVLDDCQTV